MLTHLPLAPFCCLQVRGLREPVRAIRRKCAVIIEIMSKVVDDPRDAVVFLPRLLPGVETVMNEESDPECRTVAQRTLAQLQRIVKVRPSTVLAPLPCCVLQSAAAYAERCYNLLHPAV